jgi:cell division septum initiation protein DivIVA
MQVAKATPIFHSQLRGLDRAQVADYVERIHSEMDSLKEQAQKVQRALSDVEADRQRLETENGQLRSDITRLSGPIDSVEGMSDRIARMMRVASDEARRTKAMAREEAELLTEKLRDELEAAKHDRSAAAAALAELQASTAARREQILAEAKAEAEQLLQAARDECVRMAQEAEDVERRRREAQLRLADEDERRRRETQQRMDQQIKSAWEQAETQVANLEKEGRLRAAGLIATAERDAGLITERTEAQVKELLQVRGEVVAALSEIQSRIETAIRRDRISVVKSPEVSDHA